MGQQENNWVKINEEILSLEKQKDLSPEWIEKWNKLIKISRKFAGCLKREYEKNNRKTAREEYPEKDREGTDVGSISKNLEEEKA